MKVLPDGSINFYMGKAKLIILAICFIAGIGAGAIMFIKGGDIIGLLIVLVCAYMLYFFLIPVLSHRAFITIKDNMIVLHGCVPLFLEDVIGTKVKYMRSSKYLIFDVGDISKYKVNAAQKANNAFGFGYFYIDINALAADDQQAFRQVLAKFIPAITNFE